MPAEEPNVASVDLVASVDPAPPEQSVGDCMVEFARTQVGVTEATGNNDGPEVDAYLASVGLGSGYKWCGAFPHYCYRQCGLVLSPRAQFASAAYWHPKDRRVWERALWTPGQEFVPAGKPGYQVGFYFKELKRIAHTEVFDHEDEDWIYTVGGNTSDDAGVNRDGGAVHARKRMRRLCTCISRWP